MWTQSPEALCATWLVNEGWPMVSHNDYDISEISEAVSTCSWIGWPFNCTATYFRFDFGFGRKVATRLFGICFVMFVAVMWGLSTLCRSLSMRGAECFLMAQSIAAEAAVCLGCTVPYKIPAATIPASGWGLDRCWCLWGGMVLFLYSVNHRSCWLLYHSWIMP